MNIRHILKRKLPENTMAKQKSMETFDSMMFSDFHMTEEVREVTTVFHV